MNKYFCYCFLISFALSFRCAYAKIGCAFEANNYVYIYDDKGNKKATIPLNAQSHLLGYTSDVVSILYKPYIYLYDENGRKITTISR